MAQVQFSDVAICVVNDNRGIYAPQEFAKRFLTDDQKAAYPALLEGPDNEDYWDQWVEVVYGVDIIWRHENYRVYQDGHIWLIPCSDYDNINWEDVA